MNHYGLPRNRSSLFIIGVSHERTNFVSVKAIVFKWLESRGATTMAKNPVPLFVSAFCGCLVCCCGLLCLLFLWEALMSGPAYLTTVEELDPDTDMDQLQGQCITYSYFHSGWGVGRDGWKSVVGVGFSTSERSFVACIEK